MRKITEEKRMFLLLGGIVGVSAVTAYIASKFMGDTMRDRVQVFVVVLGFFLMIIGAISAYVIVEYIRKLSYKREEGQRVFYSFVKRSYLKSIFRIVFLGGLWYIFGAYGIKRIIPQLDWDICAWITIVINILIAFLYWRSLSQLSNQLSDPYKLYEESINKKEFISTRVCFFFIIQTIVFFFWGIIAGDIWFPLGAVVSGAIVVSYVTRIMKLPLFLREE